MDTMDTANLTNITAMMTKTTQFQKKRKLIDALDTPETLVVGWNKGKN